MHEVPEQQTILPKSAVTAKLHKIRLLQPPAPLPHPQHNLHANVTNGRVPAGIRPVIILHLPGHNLHNLRLQGLPLIDPPERTPYLSAQHPGIIPENI